MSTPPKPKPPSSPGSIRSGKLAGKTMGAAIWILAWPVLVQQTAAAFLGLFDKILAGHLPRDIVISAMDGLGIGAYVGWFVGIAMTGLGIGGQAIIARAFGSGDADDAHSALGQAVTLSVVWGVIVGGFMWWAAPFLAEWCRLPPDAAAYCTSYVRILAAAQPVNGILMVGAFCLHGAGETKWPMFIALVINVVNVVLSWILSGADLAFGVGQDGVASHTLVNPFSFDLDVRGIALGTAVSYGVGSLLTLLILLRGVKDLRLHLRWMRPQLSMVTRFVRIGIPGFLEGISMWAVNLFVLMFIGQLQTPGLQGAHIIAVQWEAFSFLPGFAIGTAAGALAGQYIGAGSPAEARKAILRCTMIACVVMSTLGLVFVFYGDILTRIMSREAVHLDMAPRLLVIGGSTQLFFAIAMVFRLGLRGMGDTLWALIITTASSYGVRLPMAWLLGIHLEYGLVGIWFGLCGEFAIRAGLFAWRFLHGGWQNIRV